MSETIIVSGRRRFWPEEVKRRMLAEAKEPGESICSVARRHELDPAQLYQWRKKFRESDAFDAGVFPGAGFLPFDIGAEEQLPSAIPVARRAAPEQLAGPKVEPGHTRQMEIVLGNGRLLLLPVTVSAAILKDVVDVLERP